MKFAAISDIHGNLTALDAVLDDIARRGIERIVNLGDILSGPLDPVGTADRLMELGLPTIRGNHERQLLTVPRERMNASDRYAIELLRPEHLAWLESLPETLHLDGEILLVHGTPASDLTYFLETVTEAGLRPASEAEIADRAGPAEAALILCGHTHIPRAVGLADGRLVVNPGSVGLAAYTDDHPVPHKVENGSPHARYAVLEKGRSGWSAEIVLVAYDWERPARIAAARGRADWAAALRTGTVAGPV